MWGYSDQASSRWQLGWGPESGQSAKLDLDQIDTGRGRCPAASGKDTWGLASHQGRPPKSHSAQMYGPGRSSTMRPSSCAMPKKRSTSAKPV